MNKFFLPALLALVFTAFANPAPAHAQSFSTLMEQRVFYQFSSKRSPARKVHEKMSQRGYKGLVLWVAKPKPGRPTVLYLPGSGGDLKVRTRKFRFFIAKGYGVVAMAYPGMAGSKGEPSRKRIQSLANQLYRDIGKFTPSKDIVIMGESLGTGVALEIATSKAGRARPPSAIILQSPYTSLVDLTAAKNPALLPFFVSRTDLWPSKRTIQKLKLPIFIMHGKRDKTVPFKMGKTLYALSPSRNKVLATHPDAGHSSIWRSVILKQMHAWLKEIHAK
ncbi:alpha/beta hydrolase [Aliiroseovarius marinus]|uniref:alpha/beta hydrolase n=1 Tax=Aliiroseovarius marinus TaxID=2500159 RepID=UPI003D7D9DBF